MDELHSERVGSIFTRVARYYDLMNDLMSFGLHRLWKRALACLGEARPGQRWLDLASGSGDVAALLAPRLEPGGTIVLADASVSMLACARARLGVFEGIDYALCTAERLPFDTASFDGVTCAFGLRNFTDRTAALRELHRVVRPGGRLLILEFSRPQLWLRPAYRTYLTTVLPFLGAAVAGDVASYRYLGDSILAHPAQDKLASVIRQAGWEDVDWLNLTAGVVAIHHAWRSLD